MKYYAGNLKGLIEDLKNIDRVKGLIEGDGRKSYAHPNGTPCWEF